MICIDVGSGYSPKEGYLKCDINYGCDFYSIDEIPNDYVDKFHIRNTIHHIEDLEGFSKKIHEKQKEGGLLEIIDCKSEYYHINYFLDFLWYRYIFNRYDIFICKHYRNIETPFVNAGYVLESKFYENEKLILILKKKKT